jgi:hypothetical protein
LSSNFFPSLSGDYEEKEEDGEIDSSEEDSETESEAEAQFEEQWAAPPQNATMQPPENTQLMSEDDWNSFY